MRDLPSDHNCIELSVFKDAWLVTDSVIQIITMVSPNLRQIPLLSLVSSFDTSVAYKYKYGSLCNLNMVRMC